MKQFNIYVVSGIALLFCFGCFKDNDDTIVANAEINDFVWKGLNATYLYKDNIPDLDNNRFSSDSEYTNYLNQFSTPESLFESLIYERATVDRFSVIVDDYYALEAAFSGVYKSNGMEFGLVRTPNSESAVFGFVRYVLPNTSASSQGIQRGTIFNGINGELLYYNSPTDNNFSLLNTDSYSIDLATYNDAGTPNISADDTVTSNNQSVSLTKAVYNEDPILISDVLTIGGNKIGYLMYNGFTGTDSFNLALNDTFGMFALSSITDLVLDLRYNPGGSVQTAVYLASMITGQFTGDVFVKEQWNNDIQTQIQAENPDLLINPFVSTIDDSAINHLNLSRVYVLTTKSSASASELIINGLIPYIDVVQVGTSTAGKYQASITLYDSEDFGRQSANPKHTYALQPLVLKSLNKNDETDYFDGLYPDIEITENYSNLGVLGDPNEPLLAAAIANIQGFLKTTLYTEGLELLKDSKDFSPFAKEMYINKNIPNQYYRIPK